jgi:hypothetical protein
VVNRNGYSSLGGSFGGTYSAVLRIARPFAWSSVWWRFSKAAPVLRSCPYSSV